MNISNFNYCIFTQCLAQQAANTMYYFYSRIVDSCWSQEYYASEEKKVEEQSALVCLASNVLLGLLVFMIILLARGYLIAHTMKFKNICFGSISRETTLKLSSQRCVTVLPGSE